MLVTAPAVAALKVVVGHLWRVYVLRQPPEELEDAVSAAQVRARLWIATSGPHSCLLGGGRGATDGSESPPRKKADDDRHDEDGEA